MKIVSILNNDKFLDEYISLCNLEWGSKKKVTLEYISNKKKHIINDDKVISILGLVNNNILMGFISLFKYDGEFRKDLTPWYATMYIKEEYRNKGYSKILNKAILDEAIRLRYTKIYLKTSLINYYEKFGFRYIEKLENGENLYYIDLGGIYV